MSTAAVSRNLRRRGAGRRGRVGLIDAPSPGRLAPSPTTALAQAGLGLVALAEASGRAVTIGVSAQVAVVLCLLALASTLPLVVLPPATAATAIVGATLLSVTLFGTMTVAGLVAGLIALYLLGRHGAVVLGCGLSALLVILAFAGPRPISSEAAVLTLLLACLGPASLWAGNAGAARQEAHRQTAARQAAAGTLLEHTARGERTRIARELHDVVAHHISMVAVQAETARLTTPGMPAAGAERLSAIGDTARAALTDMRRLLGVLREDVRTDAADRRPQPGIAQLAELLDDVRDASGCALRLIVLGQPRPLDPGVELATYRIAQEALTNARRHAPGAAVDVELQYGGTAVRVRIRDNGPGPSTPPTTGGHGLTGMRERAAAVGGQLRTGAVAGGGFLVEATLPADAKVAA